MRPASQHTQRMAMEATNAVFPYGLWSRPFVTRSGSQGLLVPRLLSVGGPLLSTQVACEQTALRPQLNSKTECRHGPAQMEVTPELCAVGSRNPQVPWCIFFAHGTSAANSPLLLCARRSCPSDAQLVFIRLAFCFLRPVAAFPGPIFDLRTSKFRRAVRGSLKPWLLNFVVHFKRLLTIAAVCCLANALWAGRGAAAGHRGELRPALLQEGVADKICALSGTLKKAARALESLRKLNGCQKWIGERPAAKARRFYNGIDETIRRFHEKNDRSGGARAAFLATGSSSGYRPTKRF
ncbi:hypothetical protein ERJ75_001068600 [Trypanosoma vivax]|nr:hypothetical protein ERJ75_001068600 [Trypanosoma vivax]